ncbi:CCT motif [Fragilaria crotonensis]|nr:CCT motif [Fragilaria crotonensis]
MNTIVFNMQTTYPSTNYHSMTGSPGGTDVMSHVMSLRSRKPSKKLDGIKEEEAALISAEERMMDDEEIASVDEFGNPIVDMAKLEERNLSVAMSRSVLDMPGGEANGIHDDDEDNGGHRRYGLRKSNHLVSPTSAGAELRSGRESGLHSDKALPTTITPLHPIPNLPPVQTLPPIKTTTPSAPPMERPPRLPVIAKPLQSLHTSYCVPNPLANIATPLKPPPSILPAPALLSTQATIATAPSQSSTVPCPLPAVPCPLVPSILPAPAPTTITSAQPESHTLEFSSTDLLPNRRGRIFSMDIDAAGLDFPDMSVDNIASGFDSPALPPLVGSHSNQDHSSSDHPSHALCLPGAIHTTNNTPMPVPSAVFSGRDRAMSFEFFSLGINADEPLPPVSEDGFMFQPRPRGDSIIFDPVSFQDGGIHEEKALFRSRESSIDLPSKDEMAIMNAPGFAPPPVADHKPTTPELKPASFVSSSSPPSPQAIKQPPSPTDSSAHMATLPSSLNTTMSHATFQMDLLNKDGRIGIYLPDARKARIAKFHSKRKMRIWRKRIKYDCRKKLADSRPRIKGRFVKRSDMDED